MKRTLCLLLLLTVLFTTACRDKNEYPPVESTVEESREIAKFSSDGETYFLRYELYRALYLNLHDGADRSGESAVEYRKALDGRVIKSACEIFGAIAAAKKIGCDAYGKEADKYVQSAIKEAVGDGSYDEYLASLSGMHMNYAVQELLYRYAYALEALDEHYLGEGAPECTEEEMSGFYYGETCARALCACLPAETATEEAARAFREALAKEEDPASAAIYIITHTLANDTYLFNRETGEAVGMLFTKNGHESIFFEDLSEAALALKPGEISEVIFAADDRTAGYYVLYGLEKSKEYFTNNLDNVTRAYLESRIGDLLEEAADALYASMIPANLYETLDRGEIR